MQDNLSKIQIALEPYGWFIYKTEDVGPRTVILVLESKNGSIRKNDFRIIQKIIHNNIEDRKIESLNLREDDNNRVEVVIIFFDGFGDIKYQIPS
jgi:hypothetical protein